MLENLVIFLLLPLAILLSVRRKTRGQEKIYFFRPMSWGGGGKYAIIMDSTKCFKFAKAGKELCGWRIRRM